MRSTLCILIMERLGMELARPGSARHMLDGGKPHGRVLEASSAVQKKKKISRSNSYGFGRRSGVSVIKKSKQLSAQKLARMVLLPKLKIIDVKGQIIEDQGVPLAVQGVS